jgi:two-component system nitrate/nitrite response regulator NarL
VVLADDHPIVLDGLSALINSDKTFEVVATCVDGDLALEQIRKLEPELAVLDISMPGRSGLEVLEVLQSEGRATQVVFLTASATDHQIVTAVGRGARGIMLKDTASDELLQCLHTVSSNGHWLPPALVNTALERETGRRVEANRLENLLTAREREIALLAAEGLSNKHIARRVNVSEGTIKIHLHNIYQKLGVANRTAMTVLTLTYRDKLMGGTER